MIGTVLVILLVNHLVGATVWTLIDHDDGRLLEWSRSAPVLPDVFALVVVQLWPIGLAFKLWHGPW